MSLSKIVMALALFLCLFTSVNAATVFSDNFNDFSISDWDINLGTWSAGGADLTGGNLEGAGISHAVTMASGTDYNISYMDRVNSAGGGTNGHFIWFTDQNGISGDVNGYEVIFQTGTGLLRRIDNGAYTTLANLGSVTADVNHTIAISHLSNGLISVSVDGTLRGTATDSNYVDGNKIVFGTDNFSANHNFDNILISTFTSASSIDTNLFYYDQNYFSNPNTDVVIKTGTPQYFDFNAYTNWAQLITVTYYDGNTVLSSTSTFADDINFSLVTATNNLTTDYITLIAKVYWSSTQYFTYVRTYHLVDNIPSNNAGLNGLQSGFGVFGALIITLCAVFITMQQFGGNAFGNNESQFFIVGLVMITMGVLLFPGDLFIVFVAIAFGGIMYLSLRT